MILMLLATLALADNPGDNGVTIPTCSDVRSEDELAGAAFYRHHLARVLHDALVKYEDEISLLSGEFKYNSKRGRRLGEHYDKVADRLEELKPKLAPFKQDYMDLVEASMVPLTGGALQVVEQRCDVMIGEAKGFKQERDDWFALSAKRWK